MKVFAFISILSVARADWTCDDCTAVVSSMSDYLTSEMSISNQIAILLAEVCPLDDNPEECLSALPEFWAKLAAVLWPGYYNPGAPWMCGELCVVKGIREINCDECLAGLVASFDQMLSEQAIASIIEGLSGDAFCGSDNSVCQSVVAELIPLALPALFSDPDPVLGASICNNAIPDICS